MIILLAPSKNLNSTKRIIPCDYSIPKFLKEAEVLVETLRGIQPNALAKAFKTNSKITNINVERFYNWETPFTTENAIPAAIAYDGAVYRALNAQSFDLADWEYANKNLRILSGLFGILKPNDLIQPYRLDVGTKLPTISIKNLYEYWNKKIELTFSEIANNKLILNLASSEYSKMLDLTKWKNMLISPDFMEDGPNGYRNVIIYTKKARGLMTRFVIKNKIDNPIDLQAFNEEGYWYQPHLSTFNKPVFIR